MTSPSPGGRARAGLTATVVFRLRPVAVAVVLGLALGLVPGVNAAASPVASAPAGGQGSEVRLQRVGPSPLSAASRPVSGDSRLTTAQYSLLALTWRGTDPRVDVRTRSTTGRWRAWQRLDVLADLGAGSVRGTELALVGPSDGLQTRVAGRGYRDLRVVLLDPGAPTASDRDTTTGTRAPSATARAGKPKQAPKPTIRSRKRWGANNAWRNGRPRYIRTIKQVHIHHTVNSNDYKRREVPGILRAIYRYHTHNLGWFDVGYNFLVDRFGRAWVGRSGGLNKPVRGAHTLGFNMQSVGIALIGNAETKAPRDEVVRTLVRLAAWKLDQYDRDPRGTVWVRSTGSDLYPKGERVRLPVIDGHRDTNATLCPGQYLYDRLDEIRDRAGARTDTFS